MGSRQPVAVIALLATACSLTTSLEGLYGGNHSAEPGISSISDAGGADTSAPDTGAVDASSDAFPNDGTAPDREAAAPDSQPDTPTGSAYRAAVMADQPLAYWRLHETTGQVAIDEMGNASPGTFSGTAGRGVPGAVGDGDTATSFDGTTTRLDIGDSFAFPGTAAFSIEVWVMVSVIDTQVRRIVSRNVQTGPDDGYALYYGDTFVLFSRFTAGTENGYAGGPTLPAGRFAHLVATYDGGATNLYIDGAVVDTGGTTSPISSGPGTLAFGDGARDAFFKFQGALDEIAVYGNALSAARVLAHYHASGR